MFISPLHQQLFEIDKKTQENKGITNNNNNNIRAKNVKILTKPNFTIDPPQQKPSTNNPIKKSPRKSPRRSPRKNPNSNEINSLGISKLPLHKLDQYIESCENSPSSSPRIESNSNSTTTSPRNEIMSPRSFEMMLNEDDLNENFCMILEDKNRYSIEQIETFLERGADINYQSENFQNATPIMIVCGSLGRKGVNAACLNILLSGRQRPKFHLLDNKKMGALHYAAKFNNIGCVLELLNAGAEVNITGGSHNKTIPIHLAAANDHIETIRHLIDYGSNCNKLDCSGQSPLEIAITSKASEECIDELVRNSNTTMLLQKCMDNCRIQKYRNIISKLATKGVEMRVRTAKNKTPLMYAASLGDAQLIRVLCSVPKHLIEGVNARDGNFHTALHSACCWGWVECAQVLIENGADIHATDNNGNTPLHRAAMWNRVDVIKLLLSCGADANIRSSFGVVPLELAYSKGIECSGEPHWESIDELLPKTNISKFLFPPFTNF